MLPGSRKTGNTSTWATDQMKRHQPLVQHATESRQQWPNAHHDWSDIPPNVATVQNQSEITGSVRLWPVTSQVGSPKNDNNHEPGRRGLPTGMPWKAQWILLAKSRCTNSQSTCHKQKPSNPNTMSWQKNQIKSSKSYDAQEWFTLSLPVVNENPWSKIMVRHPLCWGVCMHQFIELVTFFKT